MSVYSTSEASESSEDTMAQIIEQLGDTRTDRGFSARGSLSSQIVDQRKLTIDLATGPTDDVVNQFKSPLDRKQYRTVWLENGMECLCVTSESGARRGVAQFKRGSSFRAEDGVGRHAREVALSEGSLGGEPGYSGPPPSLRNSLAPNPLSGSFRTKSNSLTGGVQGPGHRRPSGRFSLGGSKFGSFKRQLSLPGHQYGVSASSRILLGGESQYCSVACSVGVGSWDEPSDFPGLAHFLEHCVFLGSAKYPDDNSFTSFLSSHAGDSNAETKMNETVYYFSCPLEALGTVLDMFAQFFIEPNLNRDSCVKELETLETEFQEALGNKGSQLDLLIQNTSNPKSKYASFVSGNRETLRFGSEQVVQELRKFHRKHYYGANMKLVVLSSESLDETEEMVRSCFSPVYSSPRDLHGTPLPLPKRNNKDILVDVADVPNEVSQVSNTGASKLVTFVTDTFVTRSEQQSNEDTTVSSAKPATLANLVDDKPSATNSTDEEPSATSSTGEEPSATSSTDEEPSATNSTGEEPSATNSTDEEPSGTNPIDEEPSNATQSGVANNTKSHKNDQDSVTRTRVKRRSVQVLDEIASETNPKVTENQAVRKPSKFGPLDALHPWVPCTHITNEPQILFNSLPYPLNVEPFPEVPKSMGPFDPKWAITGGALTVFLPQYEYEVSQLFISWQTPVELKEEFRCYYSHILGHESDGSLLSKLKTRGWGLFLTAGLEWEDTTTPVFQLTIGLTDQGFLEVSSVIALVFQSIHDVGKTGYQAWVLDELVESAKIGFAFEGEYDDSTQYVSELVSRMQDKDISRENLLRSVAFYQSIVGLVDPEKVDECLPYFEPALARFDISPSANFEKTPQYESNVNDSLAFGVVRDNPTRETGLTYGGQVHAQEQVKIQFESSYIRPTQYGMIFYSHIKLPVSLVDSWRSVFHGRAVVGYLLVDRAHWRGQQGWTVDIEKLVVKLKVTSGIMRSSSFSLLNSRRKSKSEQVLKPKLTERVKGSVDLHIHDASSTGLPSRNPYLPRDTSDRVEQRQFEFDHKLVGANIECKTQSGESWKWGDKGVVLARDARSGFFLIERSSDSCRVLVSEKSFQRETSKSKMNDTRKKGVGKSSSKQVSRSSRGRSLSASASNGPTTHSRAKKKRIMKVLRDEIYKVPVLVAGSSKRIKVFDCAVSSAGSKAVILIEIRSPLVDERNSKFSALNHMFVQVVREAILNDAYLASMARNFGEGFTISNQRDSIVLRVSGLNDGLVRLICKVCDTLKSLATGLHPTCASFAFGNLIEAALCRLVGTIPDYVMEMSGDDASGDIETLLLHGGDHLSYGNLVSNLSNINPEVFTQHTRKLLSNCMVECLAVGNLSRKEDIAKIHQVLSSTFNIENPDEDIPNLPIVKCATLQRSSIPTKPHRVWGNLTGQVALDMRESVNLCLALFQVGDDNPETWALGVFLAELLDEPLQNEFRVKRGVGYGVGVQVLIVRGKVHLQFTMDALGISPLELVQILDEFLVTFEREVLATITGHQLRRIGTGVQGKLLDDMDVNVSLLAQRMWNNSIVRRRWSQEPTRYRWNEEILDIKVVLPELLKSKQNVLKCYKNTLSPSQKVPGRARLTILRFAASEEQELKWYKFKSTKYVKVVANHQVGMLYCSLLPPAPTEYCDLKPRSKCVIS